MLISCIQFIYLLSYITYYIIDKIDIEIVENANYLVVFTLSTFIH